MKTKKLTFGALAFTLIVLCTSFTLYKIIPKADFTINYKSPIENGQYEDVTVGVNTAKSSLGLEIKRVDYYWDGKLIEKVKKSPFGLNFLLENQTPGKHRLGIKITYGGKGYETMRLDDEGFVYQVEIVK
ncbi:MAG: hypothetical protein J5529_04850 [Prevotella sp.]|nr:hypothetical protein [Prevotella sp.]